MRIGLDHVWRRLCGGGFPGPAGWAAALQSAALTERHRWVLWLPVGFGVGAALYFALPAEPAPAGVAVVAVISLAMAASARRGAFLALIACVGLGFCWTKLREEMVAAPVLERPVVAHLTGRVESLQPRDHGVRVVLDDLHSGAFSAIPARLRVTLRKDDGLVAGEGVSLTANLIPPPGPAEPGDSDFARSAFFEGIGAVGFGFGEAQPAPLLHPPGLGERIAAGVENLRLAMARRIRAGLPPREAAIAAALITGERGEIDPDDEAALRDAGLAHVLAIAGLHMALVGMGLFWLIRAILAAFPAVALRFPIKKWAAAGALAGAGFYLVISGAGASATRAFVMLAMMLIAILLDRPALSMRSLGLAALVLLLWRPWSITEPGFQMSFAAVASLIAVLEWEQSRQRIQPRGTLYRYLHGIVTTSLVGSLATLPFAIFHFDRAAYYAVPGNLLAMPVMGFVVMPMAALSVAAMPVGLEAVPLKLLGFGIDAMLWAGRLVAGWPGAVRAAPAFPVSALALMALGGLWLAIWRRRWRWLGLAPVLLGVGVAFWTPRPDLLVAADGRSVALRGTDGHLVFVRPPKDRYSAQLWLQRDGDGRAVDAVPAVGACDGEGCVAFAKGLLVAASTHVEAAAEDCARATLVISTAPIPTCRGPTLVLDGPAIAHGGGYAARLGREIHALSVNAWRGKRPWVLPVQ